MARYPRSSQYWTDNFLPLVSPEPNSTAAKYLSKLVPRLKDILCSTELTEGPRAPEEPPEAKADFVIVDFIIDKYKAKKEFLTSILQDLQVKYNYLPRKVLIHVSNRLNLPLIQVYSVATFFKSFSLQAKGKHLINVCLGAVCHVRGGVRVLEKIERTLNITDGDTTEDREFTLQSVNCLGACALGPIMVIDGEYFGQMTPAKVDSVLKEYNGEPGRKIEDF
ncbi:NAD(P)H-dependent oxidoreductase subunit E [bacterium]|nr:NAD(P)H-dependent oxidoreductase subunit E [bacterium]